MNAAIFVRGNNKTEQIEMCMEYAEQQGYNIVAVIAAQGRELPEIIAGIGTGIERVIVRDMSRLSRNALENYTVQSELEIDYGVLVEIADGTQRNAIRERLMKSITKAIQEENKLNELAGGN